jgi:hypothetical protein
MATATTTTAGHVARALRFFEEDELFLGIAVTEPWDNEEIPDTADPEAVNIGKISGHTYSGASLNSSNARATLNTDPFELGVLTYRVTALSATTYEVRRLDNNSIVGSSSYTAQANPRTDIIPGVSLLVSNTSMTTGHQYTFKVDGPIGFKAIEQRYMVVPDVSGTIDYRGQRWAIVSPTDAFDLGARYVYVQAVLRYDELPLTDFRQIGLFSGLTRKVGVSNVDQSLLPNQVETTGALELIDNRQVITRNVNQKETISFIIEH